MPFELPTGRLGQLLAVLVTLVMLAAVWFGTASPLLDWYDMRSETLAQRQVLLRHMRDLAATLPQLRSRAEGVAAGPGQTALLAGNNDAVAGAALLQSVQTLAAGLGANVASIENLPAEPAGAYRRIGLRVAFGAPWPALLHVLQTLASNAPRTLVDDLRLRVPPNREGAEAAGVDVTLAVYAYRAVAPGEGRP